MSYTPLIEAWRQSRQERTELEPGERCASIEAELGDTMSLGKRIEWVLFGGPEPDNEPAREDEEPEP